LAASAAALPNYCPESDTTSFRTILGGRFEACSKAFVLMYTTADNNPASPHTGEFLVDVAIITRLNAKLRFWDADVSMTSLYAWGPPATAQIEANPEMSCLGSHSSCQASGGDPPPGWDILRVGQTVNVNWDFVSPTDLPENAIMHFQWIFRSSLGVPGSFPGGDLNPLDPVRCDSGETLGATAGRGCVFPTFTPTYELDGRVLTNMAHIVAHIERAQRELPDHWGLKGAGPPLERTSDKGVIDANRHVACEITANLPPPDPDPNNNSCDEYPFASTWQGASIVGINRISNAWVPLSENDAQANHLLGFYIAQRILNFDKFWVRVVPGSTPGPGQPNLMVVGDSISHGFEGDYTWRYRLYQHLKNNNVFVDFVGPWQGTNRLPAAYPPGWPDTPSPVFFDGTYRNGLDFDSDHYAKWGRSLQDAKGTIGDVVTQREPDYLLVELGFNDLAFGLNSPSGLIGDMGTFINNARAANPNLRFLIANVVHRTPLPDIAPDLPAKITEYNSNLGAALQNLSTTQSPVVLVDIDTPYDEYTDTYDGVHPNGIGDYKLARAFANKMSSSFGLGPQFGSIPSSVPGLTYTAPSSLTATSTDQGITVSWSHTYGATGYWIYSSDVTAGLGFQRSFLPVGADSWRWTGLVRNHTYQFYVEAVHGSDVVTGPSPIGQAVNNPKTADGPTGIFVSPGGSGTNWIDLSWQPPTGPNSDSVSGYRAYWIDQSVSQPTLNSMRINATSGRLSNLIAGHRYAIAVASINVYGEGTANAGAEAIVAGGVPEPPTLISAYIVSFTEVDLTWSSVANAAGYWVMVRDAVANGQFSEYPCELPHDWTTWRAGLLINGADRYEFCIEAANGSLKSAPSNCLRATDRPLSPSIRTVHRQRPDGTATLLNKLIKFEPLYRSQHTDAEAANDSWSASSLRIASDPLVGRFGQLS